MQRDNHPPTPIPLAIRVYPEPANKAERRPRLNVVRPETMLMFDTETTIDATQRLLFGSYRFLDAGICIQEGIFYAPDLSKAEVGILQKYVSEHRSDTKDSDPLELITLEVFLDKFFTAAYKGRCWWLASIFRLIFHGSHSM